MEDFCENCGSTVHPNDPNVGDCEEINGRTVCDDCYPDAWPDAWMQGIHFVSVAHHILTNLKPVLKQIGGYPLRDNTPRLRLSATPDVSKLDISRSDISVAPGGYVDKAAAARYLGVSRRTLETRMCEGLPHYRPGGENGKVLFRRSQLDAWMEQYRQRASDIDLDAILDSVVTPHSRVLAKKN
jgi:excisionase family DNA binding protein